MPNHMPMIVAHLEVKSQRDRWEGYDYCENFDAFYDQKYNNWEILSILSFCH